MRKFIKFISLMLICIGIATLVGCSFGGEYGNSNYVYAFQIQYDDELTSYSFNRESDIKVSPRYKEGYVLEGFYTEQNGGGTKMLDWEGGCLSSSFSGDGSTILYPLYSPINKSCLFDSGLYYDEEPTSISYNVYGNPSVYVVGFIESEEYLYFRKVSKGNPDMEVVIVAYAEIKGDSGSFSVGFGNKSSGKESLAATESFGSSSAYSEVVIATSVRCSTLDRTEPRVIIGVKCTKFFGGLYMKNLRFEIKFDKI